MRIMNNRRSLAWPAGVLALGLGLAFSPSAHRQCRAAQIASTVKLDSSAKDLAASTQQEFDSIMKPLVASYKATRATGQSFLDWISSQKSAASASLAASEKTVSTAAAPIEAQTLIPSSLTNDITNSKIVKDMEHLFDIKSGKLVNWNQQSLDALANDLGIQTPKDVTAKSQAKASTSKLEAQVISGSGGTVQPAPVPEPSTLIFFGLVGVGLAVRQVRSRRIQAGQ